MQNNLLVYPSSRAIRQYQLDAINYNQLLDKSITIGDLLQRIVVTDYKRKIDDDLRILYLKDAISNIDIKQLGLSKQFSKFYTQSEYIFKFFNELNSEYKTIDELKNSDTYTFYEDHLDILEQIYNNYINLLEQNNYVDNITLPLDYQLNRDYILQYDKIVIFYEGYFSKFELNIIKELSSITQLQINMRVNKFNKKNIELFATIGIDLEEDYKYQLDITNQKIILKQKLENKLLNHIIYPVDQRLTQIGFIKYAIVQMIQNGIKAEDIVLLLPDEKFDQYIKIFNKYEKYLNFAMGNNITNSITMQKANAIEQFIQNNEPKDKLKLDFLDIDINFINNIKQYWNKPITKQILFEIIDFITKDEQNQDILTQIVAIKISLENLFFKTNHNKDLLLKDMYKIVLNKFNGIVLDDVQGGKITTLGILETRYVQYDGVIVVDFNDEKIPKRSVKDKFISSNIKQTIGLPTIDDRQNLQKYYYQHLFDGAKKIMISYVDDNQNSISRFAQELFVQPNIQYKDFAHIVKSDNILTYLEQTYKLDIDLSTLKWSATSLKTYLQCKRKFYLHYIKNLKEHNISLKPLGYEIGLILHTVLEQLSKNNSYFSYNDLINQISKYQGDNPYLTLDLELWKKRLKKFYKTYIERLNNGISIFKLEQFFTTKYNNIDITGVVDRIDKLQDGSYEILDYKTSNNLKVDSLKTYDKSVDFQLEFYYLLVLQQYTNISKVGYFNLYSGDIIYETVLDEKLKKLQDIFSKLKTTSVDFVKCEDRTICKYCNYKTICNRE